MRKFIKTTLAILGSKALSILLPALSALLCLFVYIWVDIRDHGFIDTLMDIGCYMVIGGCIGFIIAISIERR